ncbi:MAG: tetratricopeptide repeat protein, partial [Myxococcota bacterium]
VECEDRLREQRAAATMASRTRAPPSNRVQMVLGMAPPIIIGDRTTIRSVANMLCDQILDSLRFHEVIEVFDLRDLATDQLGRFGHGAQPSIELLARLRVVELGGGTQISIQVRNVVTHRIVWSMTLHGDDEADATFNIMRVTEFSAQVVEAIHAAVCQITEPSREGVMQAAVHQLISHSVEGQDRARRILVELQSSSGLAHAWMGYTYAVAHGERHGVLGMDELEEADYHCRRAAELDPSNPLARALIAHTNAFVLQDYAMADEHLTVARRFGPNLAMTWRSAALHAHYTGNANQARQSAERAHRLGQFSPYNGVYSTCHMITSATTGRLRDAITIGEQILKKRPGYLAALRHLSACYALEGKTSKARGLVENIRAIDPSFNLKGIREPSYPLPSAQSIELITEGFSALGMMD